MTPEQLQAGFPFALGIALIFLAIATLWPRAGQSFFAAIESFGSRLAKRKSLAIISLALAAIVLRLAILPLVPVPIPEVHDEFSYLLAADTFAHGRLANPPHPMWLFFDTMHVNQHPAYMSKYPPAQGFALAVGQIIGHPWIGCLLSVAAMVGAAVWALQGWLPPPWAFLGGILILFRLGLFSYWINSYWGGAIAAIGGALAIGALPRILHSMRLRDALILGLGETILASSRPFEGLIFSLPIFIVLLIRLVHRSTWRKFALRFALPFATAMLLCVVFMAYYNWRGTGHPLLFPYSLNDQIYQRSTPALIWQKPAAPQRYSNPQFDAFYNGWNRESWQQGRIHGIGDAGLVLFRIARKYGHYFLWPELCLPLFAGLYVLRDRRVRFLLVQMVICFGGFLLVAWFQPHYAAPLLATMFILLVQCLRHIRLWQCWHRPIGIGLSRVAVLSVVIISPFHPRGYTEVDLSSRARILAQLSSTPGNHLVIVHYSPAHNALAEWVYNRADIDHAKVVWAREIPGVDLSPLLAYFKNRHVWIVDADSPSPQARTYPALHQ